MSKFNVSNAVEVLKYKKNIILQGAPGVGKTYNTAMVALGICGFDLKDFNTHEKVMEKYEELRKSGQIGFVTFHQSMDYEDFVEGIKPELNENDDNNTINYKVKKGIFGKICKRAKNCLVNPVSNNSNFDEVYNKFTQDILKQGGIELTTSPQDKKFRIEVNRENNLRLFTGPELNQNGSLTKEELLEYFKTKKVIGVAMLGELLII